MKKFFIWYIAVFVIILLLLLSLQYFLNNGSSSNVSKISAKRIFGEGNIVNKVKKKKIQPDDVGKINENSASNYENASEIYNGKNGKGRINENDVKEIQVFLDSGYWGDQVYYYSNKIEDIKYINDYITDISTYQYPNRKQGYEYENVTFVLNNNTVVYQYIYINKENSDYIKENFTKKNVVLSETARLGCSYENDYECLEYTEEEHSNIIKCLTKIQPIYQGYTTNHGSVTVFDVEDDLIWAYQYENGKEVSYTYKTTDSEDLVQILDKLNSKKFKEIINDDRNILSVRLNEYNDNCLLHSYKISSSQESIIKYAKEHFSEDYPQNDYFILWVFPDYDSFAYVKLPITQELRILIDSIGGVIYED